MQPDTELKVFNNAVANRVLRWWEVQSSQPGNDRDVLYLRMDSATFLDERPPVMFVRISADHREIGAALRLEVVETIPASVTRNVSLPGDPEQEHGELVAEAIRIDGQPSVLRVR